MPPPDVLYNNALRDYTGGNIDLARQEFGTTLRIIRIPTLPATRTSISQSSTIMRPTTEAVKGYDAVLQNFPTATRPPQPN